MVRKLTHTLYPNCGRVEPHDNVEDRFCSEAGGATEKQQSKEEDVGLGGRDK